MCRFFSYVYLQSVTLRQLSEAQDSSQEVWFSQPCCPVVAVVGCGAGGAMGGQQPEVRCCPPWDRTQRKLDCMSWGWTADLVTPETLYVNTEHAAGLPSVIIMQ